MRLFQFFAFLTLFYTLALAQDTYQKAKRAFEAKTLDRIALKAQPMPQSTQLNVLNKDQQLWVIGKQGSWIHVSANGQVGWIPVQFVRVLPTVPPVTSTSTPIQPNIGVSETIPSPAKRDRSFRPQTSSTQAMKKRWRLSLGYAKEVKSIESASRFGLSYSLFSFNRGSTFDFALSGDWFGEDKLYQFGPSLLSDLQKKVLGGRFSFLTQMSFYYLSPKAGESSMAIGTQIGPFLKYGQKQNIFLGLPFEAILFGADVTRVTIIPTLGFQF